VAIAEGPVQKQGARGVLQSVYCRDPDGSLIEISSYEDAA
jgi:catechol 2,3-dioxygenase-like lactoylglutathione lyase family enzyme